MLTDSKILEMALAHGACWPDDDCVLSKEQLISFARGIEAVVREELRETKAEIERLRAALREVLEFQSDPKAPTIHDFGRWRRAADGLKA